MSREVVSLAASALRASPQRGRLPPGRLVSLRSPRITHRQATRHQRDGFGPAGLAITRSTPSRLTTHLMFTQWFTAMSLRGQGKQQTPKSVGRRFDVPAAHCGILFVSNRFHGIVRSGLGWRVESMWESCGKSQRRTRRTAVGRRRRSGARCASDSRRERPSPRRDVADRVLDAVAPLRPSPRRREQCRAAFVRGD